MVSIVVITTAPAILMALSRLAMVNYFCSNLLLLFLSIVYILFSQAILFQILLYALFPRFPWSALLPFPSYFNFHNLTYLGIDVSMHDISIPLQTALNYILNHHNNTHSITWRTSVDTLSTSVNTHIILIIQHSTPCNLALTATVSPHVSQQCNKTGQTQHW